MDDLIERLRRIAEGGPRDFVAYASPLDYVDALGRIRRLEAKLAETERERDTYREAWSAACVGRDQAESGHSKTIGELFDAERERNRWAARVRELEAERETDRGLLRRVVCYVIEDRARTPGFTRLARLVDEIRAHLGPRP